MTDSLLL